MIEGRVIGVESVVERFTLRAPETVRQQVSKAVRGLGLELERNVKSNQLNGGVLNRRTGRLARSVNTRFSASADVFSSKTGSNLGYGRIWELTGIAPHDVVPVGAKALYWKGAAHPVKIVHIPGQPPRPWLRPALDQMRPTVQRTLQQALRGL
jgi:hypothetical protein